MKMRKAGTCHVISFVLFSAGIPYGSVNLMYGVDKDESKANNLFFPSYVFSSLICPFAHLTFVCSFVQITSTAGGGTLTLEFGVLSRLTNDPGE